jgi:RNA polymerase sigma-70 factor (ECF subfamily)
VLNRGSEAACAETSAAGWDVRVAAARNGDREALGQVLTRLGAYLRRRAGDELDAQLQVKVSPSDIVQETLLAAHRDFAQFRGTTRGELVAWVQRILHNRVQTAGRHYRGTGKRDLAREVNGAESPDGRWAELAVGTSTPSGHAVAAEESARLEAALRQLSPREEQVIRLRNELQLSFAEVGVALECSADAARKLWSRALKRLADNLKYGPHGERQH